MSSKMKKLHFRNTFKPMYWNELNNTQSKGVLVYHILLKQNRDSKIKGRIVAGGNKHIDCSSREYYSLPTVATESVLLSCVIDAKEERYVTVIDIPNYFALV